MNKKYLTREEFEETSSDEIKKAVLEAKKIRESLRNIEKKINEKEEGVKKYQDAFQNLQNELVKIQTVIYSGGTI